MEVDDTASAALQFFSFWVWRKILSRPQPQHVLQWHHDVSPKCMQFPICEKYICGLLHAKTRREEWYIMHTLLAQTKWSKSRISNITRIDPHWRCSWERQLSHGPLFCNMDSARGALSCTSRMRGRTLTSWVWILPMMELVKMKDATDQKTIPKNGPGSGSIKHITTSMKPVGCLHTDCRVRPAVQQFDRSQWPTA